jgi:hypothetical protein
MKRLASFVCNQESGKFNTAMTNEFNVLRESVGRNLFVAVGLSRASDCANGVSPALSWFINLPNEAASVTYHLSFNEKNPLLNLTDNSIVNVLQKERHDNTHTINQPYRINYSDFNANDICG